LKRPLQLLAFLAAGVACAQPPAPTTVPAAAAPGDATVGPPAKNWVLPLFTDKEGYRSMTIRGSEAHSVGSDRIDITDLNITVFSGDAAARVDTMLLASFARFFPDEKRATGERFVRLIRDDMEVTGEAWSFNQTEKRVLIHQNVRVVLHTPLPAILK
jgi:hypothetical protein